MLQHENDGGITSTKAHLGRQRGPGLEEARAGRRVTREDRLHGWVYGIPARWMADVWPAGVEEDGVSQPEVDAGMGGV